MVSGGLAYMAGSIMLATANPIRSDAPSGHGGLLVACSGPGRDRAASIWLARGLHDRPPPHPRAGLLGCTAAHIATSHLHCTPADNRRSIPRVVLADRSWRSLSPAQGPTGIVIPRLGFASLSCAGARSDSVLSAPSCLPNPRRCPPVSIGDNVRLLVDRPDAS